MLSSNAKKNTPIIQSLLFAGQLFSGGASGHSGYVMKHLQLVSVLLFRQLSINSIVLLIFRTHEAWKWYKFDDGEVSECKMEDEEEMKNQCFGGEYVGEVFDHMLKRMSYRRQKRWWNAYILIYERLDAQDQETRLSKSLQDLTIGMKLS
jgi:hypothetical protein